MQCVHLCVPGGTQTANAVLPTGQCSTSSPKGLQWLCLVILTTLHCRTGGHRMKIWVYFNAIAKWVLNVSEIFWWFMNMVYLFYTDLWALDYLKSLMAAWLEQASQWHESFCHDLEVMSWNPSRVELGVLGTSVQSCTWIKITILTFITHTNPCGRLKWPSEITKTLAHFAVTRSLSWWFARLEKSMVIRDTKCLYWDGCHRYKNEIQTQELQLSILVTGGRAWGA